MVECVRAQINYSTDRPDRRRSTFQNYLGNCWQGVSSLGSRTRERTPNGQKAYQAASRCGNGLQPGGKSLCLGVKHCRPEGDRYPRDSQITHLAAALLVLSLR